MSFWTTLISVINLLGCTVLLPGSSKVGEIRANCKKIVNFCQLWILLEGERCTLANRSLRSKLFKMTFLTTFISTSTMYNQNWKRWFFIFFKTMVKVVFIAIKFFPQSLQSEPSYHSKAEKICFLVVKRLKLYEFCLGQCKLWPDYQGCCS